jgi:hypothetical protein
MQEFPIFTLEEANAALPEVVEITDAAQERLDQINLVWGQLPFKKYDALHGVAEEDLVRAEWAHRIMSLGIQPKGFFVIDFQSPDPDTLYCWAQGEAEVAHEHKLWETFADRRTVTYPSHFEGGPPAPPGRRDNA